MINYIVTQFLCHKENNETSSTEFFLNYLIILNRENFQLLKFSSEKKCVVFSDDKLFPSSNMPEIDSS